MNLKPIKTNLTELTVNENLVVLFSYQTPVAAMTQDGYIKTEKFWSRTTTRHINYWLPTGGKVTTKPQEYFDGLVK